ncbi:MAG: hypothetical protein NUV77_12040 [Thermoguttaceae bacterium]|nr:hypothetical protein [Thermoguttaceae bacterium]
MGTGQGLAGNRPSQLPAAPSRPGGYWTPQWHAAHPGAWITAGVAGARWWTTAPWSSAYAYCGCSSEPTTYDYGNYIVYQDGQVCYGGQPVASAEQYYQQAAEIAGAGAQTENEEWMPLGVFGAIAPGQTSPDKLLQLAVNKAGVVRGNLQDTLSDTAVQLQGTVEKDTQRVAFSPASNPAVVIECGLWNLTQDSLPVLVHFDAKRTEQRTLVRMEAPQP